MPYQQGYTLEDYGGFPGYDHSQQTHMYQTNGHQYGSQQRHPVVVIPPQPRQNVSQYYTPPQSYHSQPQSNFHQGYPSRYEQTTPQQHYYPQSQPQYPIAAQQSSQYYSAPQHPSSYGTSTSQASHPHSQFSGPLAMYDVNQAASYQFTPQSSRMNHHAPANARLLSSPDPLTTPQYQVQSQAMLSQQSRSQSNAPRPQQRDRQSSRQSIEVNSTPHSSQQRVVARVEIPVQHAREQFNGEPSPKRRRSNDGHAVPICEPAKPQKVVPNVQANAYPATSSPFTELASSQLPPTPVPNVDYRAVLLALADEYIAAAHSMASSLVGIDEDDEGYDEYYSLISTAMGSLESALASFKQPDFRTEARLRLRLATLMFEETDNDTKIEEVLGKGIALCERSRLSDVKYAMNHLLVRVMFKSRPKAALKSVDKLVQEAEALKLVHWIYTFRFLRVSLSLQPGRQTDTATLLKHLEAISELADESRHASVQIMAALLEATVHIRSDSGEAALLTQRAIATARTHQLGQDMQQLPQARALLDCLDLACGLIQVDPEQISTQVQRLQENLDKLTREPGWSKDGTVQIRLGLSKNDGLEQDTCGIMMRAENGAAMLVFSWLSKTQLYSLGFLLSGIAHMYKNMSMATPEKYLDEGFKLMKPAIERVDEGLQAAAGRLQDMTAIGVSIRLHKIHVYCARFEWLTARQAIQEMRTIFAQTGSQIDANTATKLLFLEALCRHGMGELELALNLYSSPSLAFDPDGKARPAEKDLRILATLNSIFMLRVLGSDGIGNVDSLISVLDPHCANHTNKAIRAVYFLIRATHQGSGNAIVKTKQYLQAAMNASQTISNGQLLAICVNIMTSNFFVNIVGDQAEKSAKASRTLARKARDNLWTTVANGLYADIMERSGRPSEAEAARREAQKLVVDLPESLKNVLRVEQ